MSGGRRGRLFVISGPSGVGKGSIVRLLLEQDPTLMLSLSCTTRAPREGEVDGVDYRFCSVVGFQALVDDGDLLEWAEVFGQRYGSPAEPIEEGRSRGRDVLLEIDVQGARQIKERLGDDATMIFVEPPSREELHRRLLERGTEDAEAVEQRLAQADAESAQAKDFDATVVNDDLDLATAQVTAIIQTYRTSRSTPEDPS